MTKEANQPDVREKIINITADVAHSMAEFVLIEIFFLFSLTQQPYSTRGVHQAVIQADSALKDLDLDRVREAVKYLLKKKLLRNDTNKSGLPGSYSITKLGWKEISEKLSQIPPVYKKTKWDNKWLMIVFDISSQKNRDCFRNILKRFKFGQLQKSVWITPHKFQQSSQDIITKPLRDDKIGIFNVNTVYNYRDSEIAQQAWNLKSINSKYKKLAKKIKRVASRKELNLLFFQYLTILSKDPELPPQLLPVNWQGGKIKEVLAQKIKFPKEIYFRKLSH